MKLKVNGVDTTGEKIKFQPDVENGGEQWSQYVLADGTVLRVKPVLTEIVKVENVYAPNGDPMYQFQSQLVMAVDVPEHLKRKE